MSLIGRRHQILSQERQRSTEQLERYIEEWARLKFQRQMQNQQHQQQELEKPNYPQEITGPGFSFVLPVTKQQNPNAPYEFGVPPFDSRFYETSDIDETGYDVDDENADQMDQAPANSQNNYNSNINNNDIDSKSLIPPPMHVLENKLTDRILHRNQVKQKNSQNPQDVLQKPLQVEFDNTMSLYIVALIAGLSCAFSTGVSKT